ncbi:inhibitor of nuclear factor kappa-B kinase-interacting isoform X1 [Pelobates cultripes]|uniref:Inhibitor of nuclear factor kappa-B kinase-interacting isoform X1 n=1 Tax=Pelobates cultripes TaxID=61616 RepID=A0AAD1RR92_PELCU|nr:inhibitor of nuclear factor kappa-B kinase-interacting isoform X1 [Pelobates cultripes]
MANEVKHRKKGSSSKHGNDAQRNAPSTGQQIQDEEPKKAMVGSPVSSQTPASLEVRTVLCLLCVAICGGLSWLVFEQFRSFSMLELKYQSLQTRSGALEEVEDKIKLIFGKLASTENILAEATTSSSVVNRLHQQLSSLHDDIGNMQNKEQLLSSKMQHTNMRFQNITDKWKKSLDDMDLHTSSVKSEVRAFHNQFTEKINAADHRLKLVSNRLKEMDDSTLRNMRTVKRHEEEEFSRIKEELELDTRAVKELEKQQSDLININEDIKQSLVEFQPKLSECIQHLPAIEIAVRTLLKVSNEMHELDKKINEVSVQVFNTEDNLLKVITEILEIQHSLERLQYDNSILKMQNDISVLKEKTQALLSEKKSDVRYLQNEKEPMNEDQN